MDYRCKQCQEVFKTIDARRHHVATTDDDECVITTTVKIIRTDGVFKCVCGMVSKSSRTMKSHKSCYLSHLSTHVDQVEQAEQQIQTVQSIITTQTDPINCELSVTLTRYNLVYRNEYNLLLCTQCRKALGVSFDTHCHKKHGVNIAVKDKKIIQQSCFKEESIYFYQINHFYHLWTSSKHLLASSVPPATTMAVLSHAW